MNADWATPAVLAAPVQERDRELVSALLNRMYEQTETSVSCALVPATLDQLARRQGAIFAARTVEDLTRALLDRELVAADTREAGAVIAGVRSLARAGLITAARSQAWCAELMTEDAPAVRAVALTGLTTAPAPLVAPNQFLRAEAVVARWLGLPDSTFYLPATDLVVSWESFDRIGVSRLPVASLLAGGLREPKPGANVRVRVTRGRVHVDLDRTNPAHRWSFVRAGHENRDAPYAWVDEITYGRSHQQLFFPSQFILHPVATAGRRPLAVSYDTLTVHPGDVVSVDAQAVGDRIVLTAGPTMTGGSRGLDLDLRRADLGRLMERRSPDSPGPGHRVVSTVRWPAGAGPGPSKQTHVTTPATHRGPARRSDTTAQKGRSREPYGTPPRRALG